MGGAAVDLKLERNLCGAQLIDYLAHHRERSDRVLVFSYADAASRAALGDAEVPADAWLIGSQAPVDDAFRVLPRDEAAVSVALARRGPIGGALGRAYDELGELLAIDAT